MTEITDASAFIDLLTGYQPAVSAVAAVRVAAPTARDERTRWAVGQHCGGAILASDLDGRAPFTGVDAAVHPEALDLSGHDLSGVRRQIMIQELHPASAATFAGRVAAVAGR